PGASGSLFHFPFANGGLNDACSPTLPILWYDGIKGAPFL
ncbi:MAG: hypothetical protein RLZZ324_59, partial [Candidatus Parcubacteria bacterium]